MLRGGTKRALLERLKLDISAVRQVKPLEAEAMRRHVRGGDGFPRWLTIDVVLRVLRGDRFQRSKYPASLLAVRNFAAEKCQPSGRNRRRMEEAMLSVSEDEQLTRVGPGTPMGDLMRQYWIPAGGGEVPPQKNGRLRTRQTAFTR